MNKLDTSQVPAQMSRRWWATHAAALALVLASLVLLQFFFQQFPIEGTSLAIDWRGLWVGLRANPPLFGNATGLRITPWDVLLVKPLGWLPFRSSWGLLTLMTLAVMVASVPVGSDRVRRWLGVLVLITSFPALRHIADGNFEALVIAGLILSVYGYQTQRLWPMAAGLILATAKVQEIWLVMPVLGIDLWRTWPRRRLLELAGVLAIIVIPSLLWLGPQWFMGAVSIPERGGPVDSSLWATLTRLGLPVWAVAAVWLMLAGLVAVYAWRGGTTFTREKAAALVAASLLLGPYAAGNSFLTVFAVGVVPLLLQGKALSILLVLLVDLPYLANRQLLIEWSSSYWTFLMCLTLGLLALSNVEAERTLPSPRTGSVPAPALANGHGRQYP